MGGGGLIQFRGGAAEEGPRLLSCSKTIWRHRRPAPVGQSPGYPKQELHDCTACVSPFACPVSLCPLPPPDLGTTSHALVSGSALTPNELRRKLIVVGTYETQDQISEATMG